jgi:hypothetical protein
VYIDGGLSKEDHALMRNRFITEKNLTGQKMN